MNIIGKISPRTISYCNVRLDSNWYDQLPDKNWIAFVIANNEDELLVNDVSKKCIDKNVACTCCAGQLASKIEDYFDEEIVLRNIQKEEMGLLGDEDISPMTTYHPNFSEGFWFATNVADHSIPNPNLEITDVICIDLTKRSVKKHIYDLIAKFNNGESPSEEETEDPIYDNSNS